MDKSYEIKQDKLPSWIKWVGHMPCPGQFLHEKSWASGWAPVKVANTFFRSLGAVAFACNPFTGILIYCGMLTANPHVAVAALMGGIIGILFSLLLKADRNLLSDGVSSFNSILVCAVLTAVIPTILGNTLNLTFWILISFGACFAVFIDQGLSQMMTPSNLPAQSVPFNLVAIGLFMAFKIKGLETSETMSNMSVSTEYVNITKNMTMDVDWTKYFQGTVIAAGQIYGIETVTSSLFVWFAFLIYSPLLTLMMFIGSNIGALIAIFFNSAPYTEVYIGLWSFNSLLACGGMVYFCVPTPIGIMAALVNAITAGMVQVVLTPVFAQSGVPVFSCPFNTAIMVILAISLRKESPLHFVQNRTFPELDLYLHYKKGAKDMELSNGIEDERFPLHTDRLTSKKQSI